MRERSSTRILVAEDDFLVCEEIIRSLKGLGYAIAGEASDGLEAVEQTCALLPDVVLMDIQMPELDGLAAALRIQERQPTPIVVLTAHESSNLVDIASDTGVGAYLTKPPDPGEIERAITIAMARHGDLMESRRLAQELQRRADDLERALSEIKTLRGILPICASCKKVRSDDGYWEQVEVYIRKHSDALITHGLCPECMKQLYPDYADPE